MNPAVLALTEPAQVPGAAIARLRAASLLFATLDKQPFPALMLMLSRLTLLAADLLAAAIARNAPDADLVSLSNSARILKAASALLREQSVRQDGFDRVTTMLAAKTARQAHADVHLTQREYIPAAYQHLMVNLADLRVRVLPGCEDAISALSRDQMLEGADWDVSGFADALTRWVAL